MGLMTEDYFFDTMNYSNSVNIKLHRFEVRHKNSALYGYYSVDKNKLFIGQKSTFGGVYLQDDTVPEDLENLVKKFEDEFLRKYSGYNLRLPPNYLNKKLNEFSNIFNSIGSSVITEINQYHEITNNSNYLLFSKSNRKIFRRLKANGCTIKLSKKPNGDGYSLLEKNRKLRNVKLSLSFQEIQKQTMASEGKYIYFSCYDRANILIAYSVCVRVSRNVLYILYWGEDPKYRKRSPVVMIADAAVQFCVKNEIRWLDAGISSFNGVVDKDLHDFKRRLGFLQCEKNIIFSEDGQNKIL